VNRNKIPIALLFGLLLAVSACGFPLSQTNTSEDKSSSLDQMIDVGGYRLHINCAGNPINGSPTVVMDAGGYDSSESWNKVQPEIAKFARVCVYDRQTRRLVESVEVIGYRRLTKADISVYIKTRSGQWFSNERIRRDLERILASNLFDKRHTRVTIEPGLEGGVVVIFEVVEMPLVSSVSFKGLRVIEASQIFEAFRQKGISLEKDTVYDPVKVRAAERVIQDLLVINGYPNASITEIGEMSGTYVSITFEVAYKE
jgi:hypothetical protein